jgi:hypothetical protein
VDLIDIRSHELKGMKKILCYVVCLSSFSQICCLTSKSSAVAGEAIVQILSASIRSMILPSDNGSECHGDYVSVICSRSYYNHNLLLTFDILPKILQMF